MAILLIVCGVVEVAASEQQSSKRISDILFTKSSSSTDSLSVVKYDMQRKLLTNKNKSVLVAPYNTGHGDGSASANSQTDMTLPVHLVFFRLAVVKKQLGIKIEWRTESEQDNMFWVIKRKSENQDYEVIYEQTGMGTVSVATDYYFIDTDIQISQSYRYVLYTISLDGTMKEVAKQNITIEPPDATELMQNYPNPFNPYTKISYRVDKDEYVEIAIYNLLGQRIRSLVNSYHKAGYYEIVWDGKTQHDILASSGIYIYQLKNARTVQSKRMVLKK